jgi:phosphate transport system substrate-binding protein
MTFEYVGGEMAFKGSIARVLLLGFAAAVGASLPATAQQKILIDGSTGTAPLVAALGKAFTARSGVAIEIGKGLGTKARFEALSGGKIDIAMASHGLDVDAVTKRGMTVHRVAMTPVVFGVHESVKVGGLSETQVCAVYAGGIRNWKELKGPDLAVAPLVRPESEVDMEVVRDGISCFKGLKLADGVRSLERAGDMAKALADTTGGIGMTSATVVAQSQGKIAAVTLNGVAADEANVVAGRYRLTRDAFLVIGNTPSAPVKAFVDFVRSADGAAIIKANGAIAAVAK